MIRFRFVDEHRIAHAVKRMCDVPGWDRSGYYLWHSNKETRQAKAEAEEELAGRIREIHTECRGAYGVRRITQKLRGQGCLMNRKRVARVMREREIVGITRRKSRSLTKQDRTAPPSPDLILRDFTAPMPGLKRLNPVSTRLANSGNCWPSWTFDRVPAAPVRASTVSAAAESFFAVLKAEIGTTAWGTRAEARQDIFRWIAEHYNRERIDSTIGYLTPYQARVRCHQRLDLAA